DLLEKNKEFLPIGHLAQLPFSIFPKEAPPFAPFSSLFSLKTPKQEREREREFPPPMALPQHHQFQPLYYQPPPPQHQQPPPQEQSSNLRNFYTAIDAQIPPPVAYYNPTSLQDQTQHPPYISSVDFLQARSVSTGLGLSLDNTRVSCSGDSALLSLLADDIDGELLRQDAEIDRYLKL
ncbi:hypothetical protein Tsubulata_047564, partial [Turnera subulata]